MAARDAQDEVVRKYVRAAAHGVLEARTRALLPHRRKMGASLFVLCGCLCLSTQAHDGKHATHHARAFPPRHTHTKTLTHAHSHPHAHVFTRALTRFLSFLLVKFSGQHCCAQVSQSLSSFENHRQTGARIFQRAQHTCCQLTDRFSCSFCLCCSCAMCSWRSWAALAICTGRTPRSAPRTKRAKLRAL